MLFYLSLGYYFEKKKIEKAYIFIFVLLKNYQIVGQIHSIY
jgi:hypothetical protein